MTTEVLSDKDVAEKMKVVCKSLGWKADPISEEFHHVYGKAHVEGFPSSYVSMTYGQYPSKGRITVTARTDHDSAIYRYGEMPLSITVSAVRPAHQIISESQRRFVPQFLKIARKAEEIQKKQNDYKRRLEPCLGRLKGGLLEDTEKQSGTIHLHLEDIWGAVKYGGDDQVALDFHNVATGKVRRILAILRENTGSSKDESLLSGSERRNDDE